MPDFIVAPSARADLFAQWDYFAEDIGNPDVGDRFISCAERTFKDLAQTPGLGRPRSFGNPKLNNIRSWRIEDFPMHLVFYRPLPDQGGVEIVRVLHGARDLEDQFKE